MPISIQHQRSANRTLRIVCPNGHLGFAPIKTGSFEIGVASEPDLICADSGSCDIGPGPLGADVSSSPLAWQTHDLEHMLLAARRLGVPMIIGSAGDTGTNSRVDLFVQIIKDLARKHALPAFRVGWFHSEVPRAELERRLGAGEVIGGLDDRPALDAATLAATDRIVAVAGVHPYIALLERRCRRDHRRSQQRLRHLRRAGHPRRLSRSTRLLLRQGPGVRLVLRRTLWRQGVHPRRDHHGGREGDRDAARAALHDRLRRRTRNVRAREPVLRIRARRSCST